MHYKLKSMPTKEVQPGFSAKFIHSDNMTSVYWEIREGSVLPEHSHPHEQVVHLLKGEMELVVGGQTFSLRTGDVYCIKGGQRHGGKAISAVSLLDVFYPVREDFRKFTD